MVTLRKYSVIIPLGVSGLFHVNVTVVIVEVEAKSRGALYGPGEREREEKGRMVRRERESEHQLNFQKQINTILHTKLIITHKDFDRCKPYDHMYKYFNHLLSCAVMNLH